MKFVDFQIAILSETTGWIFSTGVSIGRFLHSKGYPSLKRQIYSNASET